MTPRVFKSVNSETDAGSVAHVANAARIRSKARWLVPAFVLAFFLAYSPAFFHDWRNREWITLFTKSGQRLLAGETLYRTEDRDMYAYLPALSVLTLPLAVIPAPVSISAWYAITAGCLVVTVWGAWRLTAGKAVPIQGRWGVVLILTVLLSGRYLLGPLENHQFDAAIAALVLGGLVAWTSGRWLRGAFLLGTGAALKGTPLLFAPYLIWRGQWRMAVVLVATMLAWNLVPDLVGPRASGRSHLADCHESIIVPARQRPPGVWLTGTAAQQLNQSLGATVHRFATFGFSPGSSDKNFAELAHPSRARRVQTLIHLMSGILIGLTLWAAGRRWPVRLFGGELRGDDGRLGLEAGMVVCLMLLLSPQSSKAHFVVMALPVMQIVRQAVIERSRVAITAAAILAVLGPLSVKGLIGSELGNRTLLWGAPTFFTLTCLAALWHFSRTLQNRGEPPVLLPLPGEGHPVAQAA